MTPNRHRFRRVLKWTGVGVCVMIAGLWVVSLRYIVAYDTTNYVGVIGISRGCVGVAKAPNPGAPPGWRVYLHEIPTKWLPTIYLTGGIGVEIPLWIPFFLVAIATVFFFRHDRRLIAPGHCPSCNYNLTGNLSGICPECGMKLGMKGP